MEVYEAVSRRRSIRRFEDRNMSGLRACGPCRPTLCGACGTAMEKMTVTGRPS